MTVDVSGSLAWRHPGFSAHVGEVIPFKDIAHELFGQALAHQELGMHEHDRDLFVVLQAGRWREISPRS
jgi:hypothetical protein